MTPAFTALLTTQAGFGYAFSTFLLLPKYLVTQLGAGPAEIGLVTSAYGVATVLTIPVMGAVVDRYGRRRFLIAGALVMVAFFAVGLFGYDVYQLLSGKSEVEKGILTILGSLLILWAAIELIHQEMEHLRGGSFALEAFITLAIAALIRKILIFSLSPAQSQDVLNYGALVLCLGVSYWLITHRVQAAKK